MTLKSTGGDVVPGTLSVDKTTWTPTQGLLPATKYTFTATANNADGESATKSAYLTTMSLPGRAAYTMIPSPGSTVGVGQPIVAQFNSSVDRDKRAAIERRMVVTTTPPTTGAWGWLDGRQLIWRPAAYWKPGTKVTVKANITGIETRPKLWTGDNDGTTFTVGDAMISTVDIAKYTMTVTRNGTVVRKIPITTGKPGFDTRNGIKVMITREKSHRMRSITTGIPADSVESYDTVVPYAMRLTWTGEFVHSRSWNTEQLGVENGSHGCTGMSVANAKWMYDNSRTGDVVKYLNGKRSLEPWNGYTMWNVSLAEWAKNSAL